MTNALIVRTEGEIAEIILNNPTRRNAMTGAMWQGLTRLIEDLGQDNSVRVIILHGGDCGHFSAGADMSEFEEAFASDERARANARIISDTGNALEACPKPIIAAIEGSCMGGALGLAGSADLRVGAAGAQFSLPPAKLGVAYPIDDLRRLTDLIGAGKVRDLFLTARVYDVDEAEHMGFLSRRCEAGQALATAKAMAADMLNLSGWSHASGKTMLKAISQGVRAETPDMFDLFVQGFRGEDFQTGYRAFLNKRAVSFKAKD